MEGRLITKNTFAGERPVFYDANGKWSFDPRELLADPEARTVSRNALYDFFLYRTVLAPHAMDAGLSMLFPGEELWIEDGKLGRRNPDYNELGNVKIRYESLDYFVDRLDKALEEYVTKKVAGAKHVGATLSGGIDSAILASYLPKEITTAITWGGWGADASDVRLAKQNAKALGFEEKQIIIAFDYDKDEALYEQALPLAHAPFMFSGGVTYLRICDRLREEFGGEPFHLTMGQNADTIAAAFHATVWMSVFQKVARATQHVPIPKELLYRHRKYLLFTTPNPVLMATFFQSNGMYPAPWLNVPASYFSEMESELIRSIGHRPWSLNDTILMEELMTEARRNQLIQNMLPPLFGATVVAPYFDKEVIRIFLEIPWHIRAMKGFNKIVLHELAKKRGLPREVTDSKVKRGLAYNYRQFVAEGRHLPIWNGLEADPLLNGVLDVKALRAAREGNYLTMDPLRSLQRYLHAHGFVRLEER